MTVTRVGRGDLAGTVLGLALGGVGVVNLVVGDAASGLTPVATSAVREMWGYVAGGGLVLLGAWLASRNRRDLAGAALAVLLSAMVVILHVPQVATEPGNMSAWVALFETLALSGAGATLAALARTATPGAERARALGRNALGGALVVFGVAHFAYASFIASLVPAWMPARLFFAYFTGAAHLAGGASLLFGLMPRLSAIFVAAMFAGFAVLVHVPRVAADPAKASEWDSLFVAVAMCGAALAVRAEVAATPNPPLPAAHAPGCSC